MGIPPSAGGLTTNEAKSWSTWPCEPDPISDGLSLCGIEVAGLKLGDPCEPFAEAEVDCELKEEDLNLEESELKKDFPLPELDLETLADDGWEVAASAWSAGAGEAPLLPGMKLTLLLRLVDADEFSWSESGIWGAEVDLDRAKRNFSPVSDAVESSATELGSDGLVGDLEVGDFGAGDLGP